MEFEKGMIVKCIDATPIHQNQEVQLVKGEEYFIERIHEDGHVAIYGVKGDWLRTRFQPLTCRAPHVEACSYQNPASEPQAPLKATDEPQALKCGDECEYIGGPCQVIKGTRGKIIKASSSYLGEWRWLPNDVNCRNGKAPDGYFIFQPSELRRVSAPAREVDARGKSVADAIGEVVARMEPFETVLPVVLSEPIYATCGKCGHVRVAIGECQPCADDTAFWTRHGETDCTRLMRPVDRRQYRERVERRERIEAENAKRIVDQGILTKTEMQLWQARDVERVYGCKGHVAQFMVDDHKRLTGSKLLEAQP